MKRFYCTVCRRVVRQRRVLPDDAAENPNTVGRPGPKMQGTCRRCRQIAEKFAPRYAQKETQ